MEMDGVYVYFIFYYYFLLTQHLFEGKKYLKKIKYYFISITLIMLFPDWSHEQNFTRHAFHKGADE